MNFFEQQDRAKKNSTKLFFLFIFSLFCITAIVSYATSVLVVFFNYNAILLNPIHIYQLIPADYLLLVIMCVVGTISIVSIIKIITLSSNGGRKVAMSLNARELTRNHATNNETMLLNIVEEISIASSIPVPPVYILEDDTINAFAAGNSYEDAVIGITRGAINKLNRDELQGVIAHEFSHIFNGDMKLNIKSIGILSGIVFISLIGTIIIRATLRGSVGSSSKSKKDGAAAIVIIACFGIALYIIGLVGQFFGNIIKAAINRQREYLADASAVQFTRNPEGIANALKKIGYYGSNIKASDASEFSHFYISEGVSNFLSFDTHPPLNDRIKRIDPSWDSNFDLFIKKQKLNKNTNIKKSKKNMGEAISKVVTTTAILDGINSIGNVSDKQIITANQELDSIPKELHISIDNPLEASFLIFNMVLDEDKNIKNRQMEVIISSYQNFIHLEHIEQNLVKVENLLATYKRDEYLNLILLCTSTLKQLTNSQYNIFKKTLNALIDIDDKISWFEWNIKYLVLYQLDIYFGITKVPKERHKHINSIKFEIELFLSALSFAQTKNDEKAKEIFDSAKSIKNLNQLQYIKHENITNTLLSSSLDEISKSLPAIRRDILEVSIYCVKKDETITPIEFESIHALGLLLRLPFNIE